jgi:hypothetical protein
MKKLARVPLQQFRQSLGVVHIRAVVATEW